MEEELDIPTCLFGGPPVQDDIIKLAESQQGFMNIFARPLFECVTDVLPALQFTVDELDRNKNTWQDKIVTEREKQNCNCGRLGACRCSVEGTKRGNGSPKSTQGRTLEGSKSSEPIDSPRQDSDILGSTATATSMSSGSVSRKGSRGRSLSREESVTPTNMNGISAPATLVHEKARTKTSSAAGQTSTTSQRAVSAHHHLTKHHKDHDEMPNGVLNTGFAASETDVRYLGDSNSKVFLQENGNGEVCEGSLDSQQNSRKGKRFAGSIKRMWKKRWRNTSTQNHAVSAPGGLESPPPNVSGRVGGS